MNHIKIEYTKPKKTVSKIKPTSYSALSFGIEGKCTGYRTSFSVISSGLPSHKDLTEPSDTEVFIEKTNMTEDNLGIATMYAGILASNNPKGIKGLVPKSKAFYVKAINEKKHSSVSAIGSSILWSMIQKVDVAILTTLPKKKSSHIEQVLRKAYMMNLCVFVHRSNISKAWEDNPHITIIDSEQAETISIKNKNDKLVIAVNNNYTTYLNNKYIIADEKTASLSIAAGLALILIQKNKNNKSKYTPNFVRNQLINLSKKG
jgi:hypothetical protein